MSYSLVHQQGIKQRAG